MARFKQINLAVNHMDGTLDFYRRLGIDIPDANIWRTHSGAHHATGAGENDALEFDSHKLAHAYNHGFAAERGRITIGIELETRDAVDALWAQLLEDGVQGLQPPFDAPWGERFAIVEDPDGNPVALSSPVDPEMRGPIYDI